jgi:uncharacterized protein YjbI with pentapeptide repeats
VDEQGRYHLLFPFDLSGRGPGKASHPVRKCQPYAGSKHGLHFPLHKKTGTLVSFVDGHPDRPVIIQAVPDPDHPSLVTESSHTKCLLTTSGQNLLHFEDKQGHQQIHFQSPTRTTWMRLGKAGGGGAREGLGLSTQGNRTAALGQNDVETVGRNYKRTIDGALSEVEAHAAAKIPVPPGESPAGFKKELIAAQAQKLRESGVENPEALLAGLAEQQAPGLAGSGADASAEYEAMAERLHDRSALEPGEAEDIRSTAGDVQASTAKADQELSAAAPGLDDARKGAQQAKAGKVEIPGDTKAEFKKAGVDPDKLRPHAREDVQRLLEQGGSLAGRNMAGAELSGGRFEKCRLDKADMSGTNLSKTGFRECSFRGAVLDKAVLDKVLFMDFDLAGAGFREASMDQAVFFGANLAGADFTGAKLSSTVLQRADLRGADFTKANLAKVVFLEAKVEALKLGHASLERCVFKDADLSGCFFQGAGMFKCLLRGCNLAGRDFTRASLRCVQFDSANLHGCDFTGADAAMANFMHADLQEAVLDQIEASGAMLLGADMRGAKCRGARLAKACFNQADLSAADMTRADLTHAVLKQAVCKAASFEQAELGFADFSEADLAGTRFTGAVLHMTTMQGARTQDVLWPASGREGVRGRDEALAAAEAWKPSD